MGMCDMGCACENCDKQQNLLLHEMSGRPYTTEPMYAQTHPVNTHHLLRKAIEEMEEDMSNDIDSTLKERGSRYGRFATHAEITQDLKNTMWLSPNWLKLSDAQAEALEMVAHKIGRILNGDPNYDDSWRDIAGYAELIVKELNGEGM